MCVCIQIYRSVLLNNGPRKRPQPDSSSLTPDEGLPRDGGERDSMARRPSLSSGTPLDQLLYRADIDEGARGDIIMFYNRVFISLVKSYALKFTPGENEVS